MKRIKKIAYSFCALASQLVQNTFATFASYFYVDLMRLDPRLFSYGWILFSIWNAINDPLFGHLSDRTRTRWGRRIPYIALGTIPLAICFALIWIPPFKVGNDTSIKLFIYYLVIIFLFDTFYTLIFLNTSALFPEMFSDLKERTEVAGYRNFMFYIGLIIGSALSPLIYTRIGWTGMGILYGIIFIFVMVISLWGSKEKKEFSMEEALPFKRALKESIKNRSFITYVLASFLVQLSFIMLTSTLPFYTKYVLRGVEQDITLMMLPIFLVSFPMLYVWKKITDKYGAKKAFMIAIVIFSIALISLFFTNNVKTGMFASASLGIGFPGLIFLFDVLLSDVVDEDELKTGVRREGIYFGMQGFIIRIAISIQAIIFSTILTTTGYDAELTIQPSSAVMGMRLLISIFPIIPLILGFISISFYPLYGKKLAEIKERVTQLHKEKIEKLHIKKIKKLKYL